MDHVSDVMIRIFRPVGDREGLPRLLYPEGLLSSPLTYVAFRRSLWREEIFVCECQKPHEVDEDDTYLTCEDCGLEWERV